MNAKDWETEISSDIGQLRLKIKYEIDYGQQGDYYTETIHPSVSIVEVEILPESLDKDAIEQITISIGRNVIDDLYYNWDYYEIKDDAAASLILGLVTDTVYATLRKGYMGNYLKFLRTTHSIQEVQTRSFRPPPEQPAQPENPLSAIFKRRKR